MTLDRLDPRYTSIFCDVWGVIHDGVRLYPGAKQRLRQWKQDGRTIILLTNAPRTAEAVARQLSRIGLPTDCYDAIATSGEAGIEALGKLAQPAGFLGTEADRRNLESRDLRFAEDGYTDIACTGLDERRGRVGDYSDDLARWACDGVTFHCLNPDKMVIRDGRPEPCAGALAEAYEALGGTVAYYGKPNPAIYDHALRLAGNPKRSAVLAIGDALATDILGAARAGIDAIFITGGIHEGDDIGFPESFAQDHGLGDWRPVAVVAGLG